MGDTTRLVDPNDAGGLWIQGSLSIARPIGTIIRNVVDGELYASIDNDFAFYTQLTGTGGGGGTPTESFISGTLIAAGELLAIDSAATVVPANTLTSSGLFRVAGAAKTSAVPLASLDVYTTDGSVVPVRFSSAPSGALNGAPVYLSTAPGLASLLPPSTSGNAQAPVGTLRGADGVTTTPDVLLRIGISPILWT